MPSPKMAVMIATAKPDEGKSDYSGPEISLPKGYTPPEDSQPDEDISVLCKIRLKDNGKACIVSMDGAPFEEEDKKVEEPEQVLDTAAADDDGGTLEQRIGNIRKKISKEGF